MNPKFNYPLIDRILDKFFSGRFIFTIACAIVFTNMSINGMLDSKDVLAILLITINFYFNRPDRIDIPLIQSQNKEENKTQQPITTLPEKPVVTTTENKT